MKFSWFILLQLCILSSAGAAQDDLVLQSRLDERSTSWLIDKTRLILSNSEVRDGMTGTIALDDDTTFSVDELSHDPKFQQLKETIGRIFGVNPDASFLRIRIPHLYYKVHTLHAKPKNLSVVDPLLNVGATVEIQGVDIGLTDGINLDFMIPNQKTQKPESFLTATLAPVSITIPESLPPAEFEVNLEAKRGEKFNLTLKNQNLESIPGYVESHLNSILTLDSATGNPVSADGITVNPVIVRLNRLTRSFTFDDFKPMLSRNLDKIITSILKEVGNSLRDHIGPRILSRVFNQSIPSSFALSQNPFYARYQISSFAEPAPGQFSLQIQGDSCTRSLYQEYQDACTDHVQAEKPARVLSDLEQTLAKDEVTKAIGANRADFALSVSEGYLNRLIKTTIDANLWNSILAEQHLTLGPRGAFIVINHAGSNPELFLDVLYRPTTGIQRLLIGKKRALRFPLRMSTSLHFENRNGNPSVLIQIEKVKSDAHEIIRGIPEYGLDSRLIPFLKKKIAKMILSMSSRIEGKNAVEMELPILRGTGLEQSWIETSDHGRIHLYFKL